jgi:hypothetical protein
VLALGLVLSFSGQVPQAAETGALADLRGRALDLVNTARSEHGRAPLTLSEAASAVALESARFGLPAAYGGSRPAESPAPPRGGEQDSEIPQDRCLAGRPHVDARRA